MSKLLLKICLFWAYTSHIAGETAFTCPQPTGNFSDPEDCGWYHKCLEDESEHIMCPYGKYWDENSLECSDESKVDCGTRRKGTKPKDSCIPGEKNYPDPNDCSKYYNCTDGKWQTWKCFFPYYFDETIGICERKDLVDCGDRPVISNVTGFTTNFTDLTGMNVDACPDDSRIYADPLDCSKYYKCRDGKLLLLKCPSEDYYDWTRGRCNSKESVECKERPIINDDDVKSNTTGRNVEACPDDSRIYADPLDCSKYYKCRDGKLLLLKCPSGDYYDWTRGRCNSKESVECKDRPIISDDDGKAYSANATILGVTQSTSNSVVPDLDKFSCRLDENFNTYPDPNDCSKYYYCNKGRLEIFQCVASYYFDETIGICEREDLVDCGGRLKTESY